MPTELAVKNPQTSLTHRERIAQVLHESLANFLSQDSLMVSGSIAYHGLLAMFPFMLLLLGLSGIAIRQYELTGRLALVLQRYLPMRPDFILRNLVGISQAYGRIGLVSFLLLLWSSFGVFRPLEKALNKAWKVEKKRSWLGSRLLALEMAFILGFVLLASSALVGVSVYVHRWLYLPFLRSATPFLEVVHHVLISISAFCLTLAMFVVLFQRLPNRTVRTRQVLPSALITAVLWEGARSLFALLLPLFNYHHIYGSIGAVVALMTWAYVSSAVTLFGAQMSSALYRTLNPPAAIDVAPTVAPVHSAGEFR